MKLIILGCGRVGAQLSRLMSAEGHTVTVIDCDGTAAVRLGPEFKGRIIRGEGIDRKVLLQAGIEQADAFTAASSSDDTNIIAARLARNVFQVPRVVARLFDPRRAELYRRLGLVSISSTTWGAERIRELLIHAELDTRLSLGHGEVSVVDVDAPPQLIGRAVGLLTVPGEIAVVAITRHDQAFLPTAATEIRAGDVLHLTVLATAMDRLKVLLGLGEGG